MISMEKGGGREIMNIENYPADIFLHIFSRLSRRSLCLIRCVCKQWDKLSRDPWLHSMHLARARATERQTWFLITRSDMYDIYPNCVELLTQDFTSRERLLNLPEGWGFSIHSCNGLLCTIRCERLIPKVIVYNPFTRERLVLPQLFTRTKPTFCFGLGFDSSIEKYKVVCVFDKGSRLFALVYTIGTSSSSSWRDTMSQPTVPISVYADNVYLSGARHWMVDYGPGHSRNLETMVISFDFTTEEFKTIPCQEFFSVSHSYDFRLVDLGGYLGMAHVAFGREHIEIWKLKDYERNVWVRECKIDMQGHVEMVGLMGEDDIVFLRKAFDPDDRPDECDELLAYNLETSTWRQLYSFTDIPHGGLPDKALLLQ